MTGPRVLGDGSLYINARLTIPASELTTRFTTSGGPGGQHANRTLSRVIVTYSVASATTLSAMQRARLLNKCGSSISASSSTHRSQAQNRDAALERLSNKIVVGLHTDAPRRATKPTKASKRRRVDEKKRRGATKRDRQSRPSDD
jgi:ribosome-associated protein